MNKKLIAGLAAIALFCGSIPAYNAFLTETSISAGAEDADIAAFLKSYTSMESKVSIAGDIPIAGRTYVQGIQFSGISGTASSVSYDVSEIGALTFTAGHVDGSGGGTATLTVYLDGVKADEFDLTATMRWKEFSVDTSAASSLRFEMTTGGSSFALVDFKLDGAGAENPCYVPSYATPEAFLKRSFDYTYNTSTKTIAYSKSDQASGFSMNGRSYYQGLTFSGFSGEAAVVSYNVENVDTLTFTIGHVDNAATSSGTLNLYLDNVNAGSKKLSWNMLTEEYTLDVSDASVVRFEVTFTGQATYGLADFCMDGVSPEMPCTVPSYDTAEDFVSHEFDPVSSVAAKVLYYARSNQSSGFQMAGRSYYQGLTFTAHATDAAYNCYNVESLDTVSFTLGHVDDSGSGKSTFSVYLDNVKAAEYELGMHSLCQDVTLDVSDAKVMRFVLTTSAQSTYGIGDVSINETPAAMPHTTPSYETADDFVGSCYNRLGSTGWYTEGSVTMQGQAYTNAVTLKRDLSGNSSVTYNTENVDSLSFLIGHADGSGTNAGTLQIFRNNQLADTVALTSDMENTPYSLDTSDASTVKFQLQPTSGDSTYALADIRLNEEVTPAVPSDPADEPAQPTEKPEDALFGDINGDGFINAADATCILQYAAYAGAGGTDSLKTFLDGQA